MLATYRYQILVNQEHHMLDFHNDASHRVIPNVFHPELPHASYVELANASQLKIQSFWILKK